MARKIQPRSKVPKPKKGQSSEEYWRERESRQRAINIRDEARTAERINEIFQSMQDSIQQEIESFYQRYADKEGITLTEARGRVSRIDMEQYERLAKKYVEAAHHGDRDTAFSQEANDQMRLYNLTMKVNRLEMLKARCGIRAMEGYRDTERLINENLEERAYSEYRRLAGILGNSVQFNENMVRAIVNASYQNATWSQRLWNHQASLSSQIGTQLASGILAGKSSNVLAREIQKLTGGSTYACQRLMRTELRRVQTEAALQSMTDNGVKEYKFMVENGVNPCDACLDLDGEVFRIETMAMGRNAPPVHPNCHCATAPYVDEEKWQRWIESGMMESWEEFDAKNPSKQIVEREQIDDGQNGQSVNKSIIDDIIVNVKNKRGEIDTLFEENKKAIRERLGFNIADNSLRKCDQKLLAQCIDQLEKLEKRFGAIRGSSNTVMKFNGLMLEDAYVRSWEYSNKQHLVLGKIFQSYEEMIRRAKESQLAGGSMPTKEADDILAVYTVTHEYGHLLQHIMFRKAKKSGYQYREDEFQKDCRSAIINMARRINPSCDPDALISQYGRENPASEYFAEVFANAMLGRPNALGKAMEQWLNDGGY